MHENEGNIQEEYFKLDSGPDSGWKPMRGEKICHKQRACHQPTRLKSMLMIEEIFIRKSSHRDIPIKSRVADGRWTGRGVGR